LTEEARKMLKDYYWPGNIRQLKNITEQISIIEQTREITADILKLYLPANEVGLVPVSNLSNEQKTFSNEREILYQVLFDMKKDMNELKKIVHDIVAGNLKASDIVSAPIINDKPLTPMVVTPSERNTLPIKEDIHTPADIAEADIIETPDYEEEALSLQDVEKDMIIKALDRHNGKRKNAAQDLKISERTLYRKIKEYNLENL